MGDIRGKCAKDSELPINFCPEEHDWHKQRPTLIFGMSTWKIFRSNFSFSEGHVLVERE